jgi:hypothetical protein
MKLYTFCICHLVEIIAERRRHWGEYCKGKSKTLFKRAVRLIVIEFRSILWSHKNALLQKKKVEISPGLPYTQGQWSQTGIFFGV